MIHVQRFLAFSLLLAGILLPHRAASAPKDAQPSPLIVVSENVHVSVGPKMALIVGRYWYQYVPALDDPSALIPIHYAAFVPKDVTERDDLLEVTQVKLELGEREFRPQGARLLDLQELGAMQAMPDDARVAWFTFMIPRDLARLRFDVLISHFQPHYTHAGKTVAAYWPWLPQLEPFRKELELKDIDFVITVEALPGAAIAPLSNNTAVREKSEKKWVLHPRHLENIAVEVTAARE